MKLLVISYYLPPTTAAQSIQIGRLLWHLSEKHEIYAVCADERGSSKDKTLYPGIKQRFKETIEIPAAFNKYLNIIKSRVPLLWKMPDAQMGWHEKAYNEIIKRWGTMKFDGIITFACPFSAHIIGSRLKRHFGSEWIAHFSDPWADNPYSRYDPVSNWINRGFEKKTILEADKLIFVSNEMLREYLRRYPKAKDKSFVVEHAFEEILYPKDAKLPEQFTVRYVGNFYGNRTPEPLFRVLNRFPGKLRFEIIGGGMRVPGMIKKYGLERTAFQRPHVNYMQSLREMKEAHVLLVIDGKVSGPSIYLPSKLIDYIGADRPLFAITPKGSASERVVREAGGIAADTSDEEGIATMISELIQRYDDDTLEKLRPDGALRARYEIHAKIEEFEKILARKAI